MGHTLGYHIQAYWEPEPGGGRSRAERKGCAYEPYVPDPLQGRSFELAGDVAADVSEAEADIIALNRDAVALTGTAGVALIMMRVESVASSRIEGLQVGVRKLLREEAAWHRGKEPHADTAGEVLRNIDAMRWALSAIKEGQPIDVAHLLEVHRRLMTGTRLDRYAGGIRSVQNWIGGNTYNPCGAMFVPPPPEAVLPLLEDLCAFCNDDMLPAVVQAAVAHAQFEAIHPFVDGNGRTGRVLIHLILKRRGLAPKVVPPVSHVLATWAGDYIAGLRAMQYVGEPGSDAAKEGLNRWTGLFAGACARSVSDALGFEASIRELQEQWIARAGKPRRNSATARLITELPVSPVLDVTSAASRLGMSYPAANDAMRALVDAGILAPITVGRRNRAFEAKEVVDLITDFERRLASPQGDTRVSPPARPTVQRRRE